MKSVSWQNKSVIRYFAFCLCLSWVYAVSSQCCIQLPFNLVPLTMQSVIFLLCAWLFGQKAVNAYFLYLVQGAAGLPFFSRFGSGMVHLLGPTGGYLIGFGFAMFIMVVTRGLWRASSFWLLIRYWFCCIVYYAFGLLQLAWFVPSDKILILGFYPFILGDFVVKAAFFMIVNRSFGKD